MDYRDTVTTKKTIAVRVITKLSARTSFTIRDLLNPTHTYIMTQHESIQGKNSKKTNLNNRKQAASPVPQLPHRIFDVSQNTR